MESMETQSAAGKENECSTEVASQSCAVFPRDRAPWTADVRGTGNAGRRRATAMNGNIIGLVGISRKTDTVNRNKLDD